MLICCSHGQKNRQKKFEHKSSILPCLRATPFLTIPYTGKMFKLAFSSMILLFLLLKPNYSNINGRKAFRLLLVSSLYDHTQCLNHARYL